MILIEVGWKILPSRIILRIFSKAFSTREAICLWGKQGYQISNELWSRQKWTMDQHRSGNKHYCQIHALGFYASNVIRAHLWSNNTVSPRAFTSHMEETFEDAGLRDLAVLVDWGEGGFFPLKKLWPRRSRKWTKDVSYNLWWFDGECKEISDDLLVRRRLDATEGHYFSGGLAILV